MTSVLKYMIYSWISTEADQMNRSPSSSGDPIPTYSTMNLNNINDFIW